MEKSSLCKAIHVGDSKGIEMLQFIHSSYMHAVHTPSENVSHSLLPLLVEGVCWECCVKAWPWLCMPWSLVFQSLPSSLTLANGAAAASGVPTSYSTRAFDLLCLLSQPGFVYWLWPVLLTHLPHAGFFSTYNRGAPFEQNRAIFWSARVPCSYVSAPRCHGKIPGNYFSSL